MWVDSRLLAVSSRVRLLFVGRLVSSGGFFYHGGESRLSLWSIALWFMFYLSLFGTGDGLLQPRVLLFGSRRLQVWGDSRLQSLIASVARLVLLTSQLCRGSIVLVQWCNISSLCRFQGFSDLVVTIQRGGLAFGCGMRLIVSGLCTNTTGGGW
ncbi:hypothetical protein F2Q70_00005109 [Brassica cretica]|uniref:Uncharacterized protein n=1 Tax=Brassica cretica TaxID=69181 RepID=A0A8S9IYQ1_BRACR|nr:hypothetical protein F2Q70_00005109 [Brassica cretica]